MTFKVRGEIIPGRFCFFRRQFQKRERERERETHKRRPCIRLKQDSFTDHSVCHKSQTGVSHVVQLFVGFASLTARLRLSSAVIKDVRNL